jgi:hypothetical protein
MPTQTFLVMFSKCVSHVDEFRVQPFFGVKERFHHRERLVPSNHETVVPKVPMVELRYSHKCTLYYCSFMEVYLRQIK